MLIQDLLHGLLSGCGVGRSGRGDSLALNPHGGLARIVVLPSRPDFAGGRDRRCVIGDGPLLPSGSQSRGFTRTRFPECTVAE